MTTATERIETYEHPVMLTEAEIKALYNAFHKNRPTSPADGAGEGSAHDMQCLYLEVDATDHTSMAHLWSARAALDVTTDVDRARFCGEGFIPMTMTPKTRFALCNAVTRLLEQAAVDPANPQAQECIIFGVDFLGDMFSVLGQYSLA